MAEDKTIGEVKKAVNNENFLMGVVVVLVLLIIIFSINPNLLNSSKSIFKEKKYNIEVTKIDGCDECFNLDLVLNSLIQNSSINAESRSLNYKSDEARELIAKYSIEKIPAAVIVSKYVNKIANPEVFEIAKNYAIFDRGVPYLDLNSGEIKGLVNLKEVYDSKCLDCASLLKLKDQFEQMGIKVKNYEKIEAESDNGKVLTEKNNLTFLPNLLISKNIEEYWWVFGNIKNLFSEAEYYSLKKPIAPYKEILTGKIKGKVSLTYITNKSCEECFDVSQLKDLFAGIGIYFSSEKYVDAGSTEGKNLVVKYNITKIPTVLLSKEILDYNINNVLERVGKFQDGEYVFEGHEQLKIKYQKIGG